MSIRILVGDVRERLAELPDDSVHCVVTSPPYYGLRDYGVDGQIGLEPTLTAYIETMVDVFRDVRRVLRSDGVCWLNIGDSYFSQTATQGRNEGRSPSTSTLADHGADGRSPALDTQVSQTYRRTEPGLKPKDLMMVPARLALALQADGWWLRSDIIWHKPNPMPESVTDRPTNAHEHIFLLTKSARYWYDADAVREPHGENHWGPNGGGKTTKYADGSQAGNLQKSLSSGRYTSETPGHPLGRNLRNVWSISTVGYPGAHFATFPPEIPRRCIKAGTSEKGACSACGAPWSRVVERTVPIDPGRNPDAKLFGALGKHNHGQHERKLGAEYQKALNDNPPKTIGWQPGCTCDADVIPCTVMDIFFGSGTTGLVADQLGRDCIGIELNPAYASMAEDRIRAAAPMFAEVSA